MNIKHFQELIELTDYLAVSGEYLIHKFKDGGNYLIIDTYGDFLILERDEVEFVGPVIILPGALPGGSLLTDVVFSVFSIQGKEAVIVGKG
mgnify:CR=1 FL=1